MLSVEDLRTPLIGPVSFTLMAGECIAISGPSGAGKSLLLRAIADLDENNGTLLLDRSSRETLPAPEWRRRVAYVPAESGWWADTVEAHFLSAPDPTELLASVGLSDALDWEISRLSTGERQRLALVRALQLKPDVLLLDEPTSALDPPSVQRVEQLLLARLDAGCAILLVTHDAVQPRRMGAKLRHMEEGRLFDTNSPQAAP